MKTVKYLQSKVQKIFQVIKNPGMAFADFIYTIYKGDKDKIPLPLFNIILKYYGGWAGVSIYMIERQYEYDLKVKKFKNFSNYSGRIRRIINPFAIL